jgi:outer membrane protein OmpA-like peptidoglycan-associated protein/uncharacterized protein YidB (DUF937 family)
MNQQQHWPCNPATPEVSTMFESIAKELDAQFTLGNKAKPFVQMLLAAMTDSNRGGVSGFVQRLRELGSGWDVLVNSWLSGDAYGHKAMTAPQVEQAFGGANGLLGGLVSKIGVGRDVAIKGLIMAVPALLSRFAQNGRVTTALPPEVNTFLGDRNQWNYRSVAATALPAAAAVAPRSNWLPWVIAAAAAALLLGYCSMQKKPTEAAAPAPAPAAAPAAAVPAPAPAPQPASAPVAVADPTGAAVVASVVDGLPLLKVYFDSGKSIVSSEFDQKVKATLDYLKANAGAKALISGFNDPTGDPVKNAELSKNRAKAVQSALITAGVAVDRTELVKPADTTAGASGSNAAARRVEVSVTK